MERQATKPLSSPQHRPGAGTPRTVSFHGGKGGVGTTSLVAECAALLSSTGRTVAAIDLCIPPGTLHYRLDVPVRGGTHTVADLVPVLSECDCRVIESALSPTRCGALLLPGPRRSEEAALLVPDVVGPLFCAVLTCCDVLLVDAGASRCGFAMEAAALADRAVLVVTPEVACLGAARSLLDSWNERGTVPSLVVNRSLGTRDLISTRELESFLKLRAVATLPEDTARFRRAADEGRFLFHGKGAAAEALRSFSEQVFGRSLAGNVK